MLGIEPDDHTAASARALDNILLAFGAVKSVARVSRTGDSESDDLLDAVCIICDRGREATHAVRASLQQSLDAHAPLVERFPPAVGGRPWTIEQLVAWTHRTDRRLARLGPESYAIWRYDISDARIGITPADPWPTVEQRIWTHWYRLESPYARAWWAHDWYTRYLQPRPCGWPDDAP